MFQLDDTDRRIVRELQRDASLSHAALADKVGASAASVWRRVRNLERENVLGPTVRLANAERLGRSVNVLCQVRMSRQTVEARPLGGERGQRLVGWTDDGVHREEGEIVHDHGDHGGMVIGGLVW